MINLPPSLLKKPEQRANSRESYALAIRTLRDEQAARSMRENDEREANLVAFLIASRE